MDLRFISIAYYYKLDDFLIYFQETFRACSDIRILPINSNTVKALTDVDTFSEDTTFDIEQFEDYYDELFGSNNNEIAINDIEDENKNDELLTNEILNMHSMQTQKLRLLKKKLILAKALKGLRKLIKLSNLKDEKDSYGSRSYGSNDIYYDNYDYNDNDGGTTIMPWWARTNSHGRRKKKRRRKKRFSFWYDVLF